MSNSSQKKITNLPTPFSSFVGRKQELVNLKNLINNTRLLTLTGIGGVGKTRLALELAKDVSSNFDEGVWLVDLAAITESNLVEQAVAESLDLKEGSYQPLISILIAYLKPKKVLLILDNCEHLISECARICQTLLSSCPDLKILATSLEGIGIIGETIWQTPPLSLPSVRDEPFANLNNSEAVQLLIARARAVQPDFELTSQNNQAVAQICQGLDGIPLALELAAARLRSLAIEQIASRLEDRFDLFKSGNRTALPRQQTLRNLIDWSYNLLTEREKVVLRRLAVFKDSFGLEAAEVITFGAYITSVGQGFIEKGEILDLISQLLNKSLLNLERNTLSKNLNEKSQARYHLLETIRQYSWEKLVEAGEEKDVVEKYLNWCLELVLGATAVLGTPKQKTWLAILELEHNNLRAALVWSISRVNPGSRELANIAEMKRALQLCSQLAWFWDLHGYLSEGRYWLEQILNKVREQQVGYITEIIPVMAKALNAAGNLAQKQNDNSGAKALLEESLVLRRQLADPYELSKTLNNLGIVAFNQGDFEQAQLYYEESLALKYQLGDKRSIGISLTNLAELARSSGQKERAITLFEEGLVLLREVGDTQIVAIGLLNLGVTLGELGKYQPANQFLRESLKLFSELGDRFNIAETLESLACSATGSVAAHEKAAHLFGAASALRLEIKAPMSHNSIQGYEAAILVLQKQLGDKLWKQHWSAGEQMVLEETIAFALAMFELPSIVPVDLSLPKGQPQILTTREVEVLKLLATGLTTKEMATNLYLSPLTINAHLRSIYHKLGITSRSAATRYAIENKLV